MSAERQPDVWLRGPLPGVDPALQPAAHSFLQSIEELDASGAADLPAGLLWQRPGGAASIGFHLLHIAGATGRLLAYSRGEVLGEAHRAHLDRERRAAATPPDGADPEGAAPHGGADTDAAADPPDAGTAADLVEGAKRALEAAANAARGLSAAGAAEPRSVGKAGLPSTVGGLVFHAAEHAQRHVGQLLTTMKVLGAAP